PGHPAQGGLRVPERGAVRLHERVRERGPWAARARVQDPRQAGSPAAGGARAGGRQPGAAGGAVPAARRALARDAQKGRAGAAVRVGGPQSLLTEQPAPGLDPVTAASVARLICDIADRTHVTSIVVTHDIEGGLSISDRVALLDGGKLRFLGTPDEFR